VLALKATPPNVCEPCADGRNEEDTVEVSWYRAIREMVDRWSVSTAHSPFQRWCMLPNPLCSACDDVVFNHAISLDRQYRDKAPNFPL